MRIHGSSSLLVACLVLTAMMLAGCGGSKHSNPVPVVSSLSPSSATAGGAAFTLTVNGSNFIAGSQVNWNGSSRTTTYVSAGQVTAAITAADIATAGSANVTVANPAPGGDTSAPVSFAISVPPNAIPTVSSLSPTSAVAGGPAFTLTVTGTNFITTSQVTWNGTALATTYLSATQVTAPITAADIATAGSANVTVTNPAPGGGTSAPVAFTITIPPNPIPAVSSLSPTTAVSGEAAFTLTITGTNFISSSQAAWNGSNRTTSYVSATQVTAAITAADIATAGSASVTVTNPAPGGGISTPATFTVNDPVPTISSLLPTSAAAGGATFTLTVDGTNFVPGSQLDWNGSSLTTEYVSATQLTAPVTAADVATAGSASITVVNPPPGGGTSTPAPFTITAGAAGFVSFISVNDSGTMGNQGGQNPSISSTGRFVTFESQSTNLVSIPTQSFQVYLRDTCMGAPSGCTPSTRLLSVDAAGTAGGNGVADTIMASVSDDGNFAVFTSLATNLPVTVSSTLQQVFEATTCIAETSCTPSLAYALLDVNDIEPAYYGGSGTAIDATGRYVVSAVDPGAIRISEFDPLGPYTNNVVSLYERDTCMTSAGPVSGCTVGNLGIDFTAGTAPQAPDSSVDFERGFSVSKGGRFVAFSSGADNLVAQSHNLTEQVYLRDTCSQANNPIAGCTPQTVLISQDNAGNSSLQFASGPSLSDDGRFVVFNSEAILAPLASGINNVYLRDTCLAFTASPVAGCTPATYLISVNAAGTGDSGGDTNFSQSISADGRYVAFEDSSPTITAAENQAYGVYVRDTCNSSSGAIADCTPRTVVVSLDSQGNLIYAGSYHALSADGHYIAFNAGSGTAQVPAGQVVLASTSF